MGRAGPTVLVVGATGKFARLITPELLRRGAVVRALVRDPGRAEAARALGAPEVAVADLRDRRALSEAVQGVDGAFHIGPAFAPDEAAMGVALVEAAERAGVRKFVFSSVIQPTNVRLQNHASKVPVEDAIYSSCLEYTVLHPANFMQNLAPAWPSIVRDGRFAEPYPSDARIARVDYRDVAELAAIALTEERLAFATLELAAGMYSRNDIAAAAAQVLGRPVEAAECTFDQWVDTVRPPYSEDQLALLAKVYDHYRAYGLGGNSLTLAAALGRSPRSLRQYIGELACASPTSAAALEEAR